MKATTLKETAYETDSPMETIALARSLAERYPQGAFFYLQGELGAGKTLFAKGIASAYGVDMNQVVSPTFALVNRYTASRTVYHVDLYRIDNERELVELGLDDIEAEDQAVLIVEWPEKLGRHCNPEAVAVKLQVLEVKSRAIRITEPNREESL